MGFLNARTGSGQFRVQFWSGFYETTWARCAQVRESSHESFRQALAGAATLISIDELVLVVQNVRAGAAAASVVASARWPRRTAGRGFGSLPRFDDGVDQSIVAALVAVGCAVRGRPSAIALSGSQQRQPRRNGDGPRSQVAQITSENGILGYPLNRSPVRRARSRTGTRWREGPPGWVNSPSTMKAVRYQDLIASHRPRTAPPTPPRVRGYPPSLARPPANRLWTTTASGNSGYMDTPDGIYWGFRVQNYANPSRNEPRGAGSAGSTTERRPAEHGRVGIKPPLARRLEQQQKRCFLGAFGVPQCGYLSRNTAGFPPGRSR